MKAPAASHATARPDHTRRAIAAARGFVIPAAWVLAVHMAHAQQPGTPPAPARPAAVNTVPGKPSVRQTTMAWSSLTPAQQHALRPLADHWAGMSEAQKRKWVEVSRTYPGMKPGEQAVLHSRMTEWVALTAGERAQARLNFARTKELSKELTPDEKKAKWQAYQSLSAEEKRELAAKARQKPAGAAVAVKPVPVQKLAVVPPKGAASGQKTAPTAHLPPGSTSPAPKITP
ncbi:MAG: DUF3106 domain-containing protein [Polaromonas sp.]|nr:DUF3106 domain-containing protein [Polaromonas sp.]